MAHLRRLDAVTWGFLALVLLYVALATAYAVKTPAWQAPDEPAHFNYIRHLATQGALPALRLGDYDQGYLEQIKAAKFPSSMSIDSIRYESHQPPLYYLTATPIYLAARSLPQTQQVLALRLYSVLLGVLLLFLSFCIVRHAFPRSTALQLGVPGFLALVPQHVAMTAAINNDTFAEVVLAGLLLATVRFVTSPRHLSSQPLRVWVVLGFLAGLVLLTKTTIYAGLALVPLALLLRVRQERLGLASPWRDGRWRRAFPSLAVLALVIALVAAWWFVRNMALYGADDPTGLKRHEIVVEGQPRRDNIDADAAGQFLQTTFNSFWAQLGWMGVPASPRIYKLLQVLTAAAVAGFLLFSARRIARRPPLAPSQEAALAMFGAIFAVVVLELLVYNLTFIQAQGRYLFPALIPIGTFFVLGLQELVPWGRSWPVLGLALLALLYVNRFALADMIPLLS